MYMTKASPVYALSICNFRRSTASRERSQDFVDNGLDGGLETSSVGDDTGRNGQSMADNGLSHNPYESVNTEFQYENPAITWLMPNQQGSDENGRPDQHYEVAEICLKFVYPYNTDIDHYDYPRSPSRASDAYELPLPVTVRLSLPIWTSVRQSRLPFGRHNLDHISREGTFNRVCILTHNLDNNSGEGTFNRL